jgi:2'-5' RNA ligase
MVIRSFVAVDFGDGNLTPKFREVQGMLEATGARMKLVEPENIHLTVKFLGDLEDSQVEEVSRVIEGISFEPFEFRVDGVGVFPNLMRPATIWAGITEGVGKLAEVFGKVNDGLEKLGFEKERRRFQPHLTIARVRGGENRDRLAEQMGELENYEFGIVKVDRVSLKKSVLTRSGPIYTTLTESKPPTDI